MRKGIEPFPPISRERSVYKDDKLLRVWVRNARVRKLKGTNTWLVDELCEPIQGGGVFWQQRGGINSRMKPYTEKYNSQAEAEDVALKVQALAEAYANGQILVPREANLPASTHSIVIEQNRPHGEVIYRATDALAAAIAEAERGIWMDVNFEHPTPASRFKIHVVEGLLQSPPFGRWLDYDVTLSWVDTYLREGHYLVLEETQGHVAHYYPARVEQIDRPTKGRLYCSIQSNFAQSRTFYKSGKHCWAPKGQSRLLPPYEPIWSAAVNRRYFDLCDWGRIEPEGMLDSSKLGAADVELIAGLKVQGSAGLGPFVRLTQALARVE